MTIMLYNSDNVRQMRQLIADQLTVDLAYCDCIYESLDFPEYVMDCLQLLSDHGIIIIQTDHHTVFEYGTFLKSLELNFVNHLVWKNEWGNHPKDRFHQCFDDILIFSKSKEWLFDSSKIQVPKATVNTKLNPSGRLTKTATAFIDDICLTTTAKERVKTEDGYLVKWQKPVALFDRIIQPFLPEKPIILDPFMGSGSLAVWSYRKGYDYYGIEIDTSIFKLASKRVHEEASLVKETNNGMSLRTDISRIDSDTD